MQILISGSRWALGALLAHMPGPLVLGPHCRPHSLLVPLPALDYAQWFLHWLSSGTV